MDFDFEGFDNDFGQDNCGDFDDNFSQNNFDGFDANNTFSTQANMFGGQDILHNGVDVATTHENMFGGHDVYEQGLPTVSTHENIFGGQNIYDHGVTVGSTHENIFGGQDLYQNGIKVAETHSNIFGGQDIMSSNGQPIASTSPNIFGGVDVKSGNILKYAIAHTVRETKNLIFNCLLELDSELYRQLFLCKYFCYSRRKHIKCACCHECGSNGYNDKGSSVRIILFTYGRKDGTQG